MLPSASPFSSPPSESAPVSAARPSTHISSSAAAANSSSRSSSPYGPAPASPGSPAAPSVSPPGRGCDSVGAGSAGITEGVVAKREARIQKWRTGSVQPQKVLCELRMHWYHCSSLSARLRDGGLHDMSLCPGGEQSGGIF